MTQPERTPEQQASDAAYTKRVGEIRDAILSDPEMQRRYVTHGLMIAGRGGIYEWQPLVQVDGQPVLQPVEVRANTIRVSDIVDAPNSAGMDYEGGYTFSSSDPPRPVWRRVLAVYVSADGQWVSASFERLPSGTSSRQEVWHALELVTIQKEV